MTNNISQTETNQKLTEKKAENETKSDDDEEEDEDKEKEKKKDTKYMKFFENYGKNIKLANRENSLESIQKQLDMANQTIVQIENDFNDMNNKNNKEKNYFQIRT